MTLEEDDPIGIDGMLQYLYARCRPTDKTSTLEELAIQLETADKYCLQNLTTSIHTVIEERVFQLQKEKRYEEETRRSVQAFVGKIFVEEAGKVWDGLRLPVATLALTIMKKQRNARAEMEELLDEAPLLKKLVLGAALDQLNEDKSVEDEGITDLIAGRY